jgi:hypothetical protein
VCIYTQLLLSVFAYKNKFFFPKFRSGGELSLVHGTNIWGAVCVIKKQLLAVRYFQKGYQRNLNNERSTTLHTSPHK